MAHALLDPTLQVYVSQLLREKDGRAVEELARHCKTTEAKVYGILVALRDEGRVVSFKAKWYLKPKKGDLRVRECSLSAPCVSTASRRKMS